MQECYPAFVMTDPISGCEETPVLALRLLQR